jgi:hypothetical protein
MIAIFTGETKGAEVIALMVVFSTTLAFFKNTVPARPQKSYAQW